MKKIIKKILAGILGVMALTSSNVFGYRIDVINATDNLQHLLSGVVPQLWKDALAKDPNLFNPIDIKILIEADTTLWGCNKKTWEGTLKLNQSGDVNFTGWCLGAAWKYVKIYSVDASGSKKEIKMKYVSYPSDIRRSKLLDRVFGGLTGVSFGSVKFYIFKFPNNQLIAIATDNWEVASKAFGTGIPKILQEFETVK